MSRLIDADALIPDFLVPTTTNNTPCKRYVSMEQIHNAPTIEPERKGKWEIKKASIYPYGNDVCCSECGHTLGSSFGYKFCPMCGCRMEVEE